VKATTLCRKITLLLFFLFFFFGGGYSTPPPLPLPLASEPPSKYILTPFSLLHTLGAKSKVFWPAESKIHSFFDVRLPSLFVPSSPPRRVETNPFIMNFRFFFRFSSAFLSSRRMDGVIPRQDNPLSSPQRQCCPWRRCSPFFFFRRKKTPLPQADPSFFPSTTCFLSQQIVIRTLL